MAKDAKKIIKEAKLKVTPARLLIIEMFSDFCKPLSAEDIFKKRGSIWLPFTEHSPLLSAPAF